MPHGHPTGESATQSGQLKQSSAAGGLRWFVGFRSAKGRSDSGLPWPPTPNTRVGSAISSIPGRCHRSAFSEWPSLRAPPPIPAASSKSTLVLASRDLGGLHSTSSLPRASSRRDGFSCLAGLEVWNGVWWPAEIPASQHPSLPPSKVLDFFTAACPAACPAAPSTHPVPRLAIENGAGSAQCETLELLLTARGSMLDHDAMLH